MIATVVLVGIGSALWFAACATEHRKRHDLTDRLIVALVFVAVLTGLLAICGGVKA